MTVEQTSLFDFVFKEVTEFDLEVRAKFLEHFQPKVIEFCQLMTTALEKHVTLDSKIAGRKDVAHICGLAWTSIDLAISSMKLFIEGHQIASGNLMRQAYESIALTILCSPPNSRMLELYRVGKFSSNKAIDAAKRHADDLGLSKRSIVALKKARDWYHEFSHPSRMTVGSRVSFSGEGQYIGAAFDRGKLDFYLKEIVGRVHLAELYPDFLDGVIANVERQKGCP